jgi:hypothetical protein
MQLRHGVEAATDEDPGAILPDNSRPGTGFGMVCAVWIRKTARIIGLDLMRVQFGWHEDQPRSVGWSFWRRGNASVTLQTLT